MAVAMILLVLFSIAADTVKSAPTKPTATLTCKQDGFESAVTFANFDETKSSQSGKITLGTGLPIDDCVFDITDADNVAKELGKTTPISYNSATDSTQPNCGGSYADDDNIIKYKVQMDVVITETVAPIVRVYKYVFNIECTLTRVQLEAGAVGFTVNSADLQMEGDASDKFKTFKLAVSFDFMNEDTPHTNAFVAKNNDDLKLRVKEIPANTDYKFTVQKCYASGNADAAVTTTIYTILENECPADETVKVTPSGGVDQSQFDFEMRALYMTGSPLGAVYVHCELFICKTAETVSVANGKCIQDTASACTSAGRKRRSVEHSRKPIITSTKQHFQVVLSGVRCPDNYVFDSSIEECTNERLLLIKGLYLDIEWDERYGNASSNAFKHFARVTGSYLDTLIKNANKDDVIKGLKIVQARKGSVILDVLITYAESVDAVKAFNLFEDIMYKTTPQMTRVVDFLNIRQDKVIEYVPVIEYKKVNMEMILVIVIVAAVILISFISGISYKIRLGRAQASPPATINNTFDNKAMENI